MSQYNLRNPAVKRLMKEAEELMHPTEEYYAQPVEDNLFEWHFTLRGPPNTDYQGGIYHGRITLPPDYPMKPPSIILLTPNGRFETNKKICLSISGHHPESWQPSWSIRTALLAIIGFMPTHGNGALGSLDYTPEERQQLAIKSLDWKCSECGYIKDIFLKSSEYLEEEEEEDDDSDSSDVPSDFEGCRVSKIRNGSYRIECCGILAKKLKPSGQPSVQFNETVPCYLLPNHYAASCEECCKEYICDRAVEDILEDKRTSLVHRQKNSPSLPDVNVTTEQTASENRSNFIYSVLIFVIISIIAFLCFRRLLSVMY